MSRLAFPALLAVLLAQQATLRVEVALVTVGVRVSDSHGGEIRGLTAGDFMLFEDGKRREIAVFSNEEWPISLEILLDRSDSMAAGGKLERAKEAVQLLVRSSHTGTEFLYLPFDANLPRARNFIAERAVVESLISATEPGSGTSLYDAVIEGLRRCSAARLHRQAVVLVTDGADQHSSHKLDEVIAEVQEARAHLYAIAYFAPNEYELFQSSGTKITLVSGWEIDNPRIVFQRLAKESGAVAYFPKSDGEMRRAVEEIASDLRLQYTIAFYPPKEEKGTYHRLEVKVKRSGARVRARPGYTR